MERSQPSAGVSTGRLQTSFLRALADHLDRRDLPPVNISRSIEGWNLQLSECPQDASTGLLSWAQSFAVAELGVEAIPTQVMVGFSVTLGGCPVRVWGCIDALREVMGLSEKQTATITVTGLADLVRQGRRWGWG